MRLEHVSPHVPNLIRGRFHRLPLLVAGTIAIGVLSPMADAVAKTITVTKDGSGDFSTIQPALDATARGDTVLIGPGRYLEFAAFAMESDQIRATFAGVSTDSLTLLGAGAGLTIIGPQTPSYWGQDPVGIATRTGSTRFEVRDLGVEGVHSGMHVFGSVGVTNCAFRATRLGILTDLTTTVSVDSCSFRDNEEGVLIFGGWGPSFVRDCTFDANGVAVSNVASRDFHVQRCEITGGSLGIQFQGPEASGTVEAVRVDGFLNVGIAATGQSTIDLFDVRIAGGQVSLTSEDGSVITGRRVLLRGSTYRTINLASCAIVQLHESDILGDCPFRVFSRQCGSGAPAVVDLTGNYWGLPDADAIAGHIWDSTDDPSLNVIVQFEPFETRPLPTGRESMGNLKARFGRK
jgi:hypothetical protein